MPGVARQQEKGRDHERERDQQQGSEDHGAPGASLVGLGCILGHLLPFLGFSSPRRSESLLS
jgi:hypothetical protein